jgi:hypothetical protein
MMLLIALQMLLLMEMTYFISSPTRSKDVDALYAPSRSSTL